MIMIIIMDVPIEPPGQQPRNTLMISMIQEVSKQAIIHAELLKHPVPNANDQGTTVGST